MGDETAAARARAATAAQTGSGPGDGGASAALLAAQARLLALRAERGIVPSAVETFRRNVSSSDTSDASDAQEETGHRPDSGSWDLRNATVALQQKRLLQRGNQGGGDLQPYPNAAAPSPAPDPQPLLPDPQPPVPGPHPPIPTTQPTIPAHPSMLLAILRQRREAAGRVWLLLRALDRDGRGWVTVDEARARLATAGSRWRCCGWRRLRQILGEGDDLFWRRDPQGRLWLRGAHRVAAGLGVERLQGYPVELPISALLGGIQGVRAAFYASFHSGRDSKPISRDTLRSLSGLAERTQRTYDRRARVRSRRNLAIGERYTTENAQERAWQRGRGVFRFIDTNGRQGPPNKEYIAWQLPNSYEATYQRRTRGSRKRLNRKLKDLVTKGIPGNTEGAVERVFFGNGALAAKAYNRDPECDVYWESKQTARGQASLWHVIAGRQR